MLKLFILIVISTVAFTKYIETGNGIAVWSECMYEVPRGCQTSTSEDGVTVVIFPDGSSTTYPPCKMPFIEAKKLEDSTAGEGPPNGNVTWAIYTVPPGTDLTSFAAETTVPGMSSQFPNNGVAEVMFIVSIQNIKEVAFVNASDYSGLQTALYYYGSWGLQNTYFTAGWNAIMSAEFEFGTGNVSNFLFSKLNDTAWVIESGVGQSDYLVASSPLLSTLPYVTIGYSIYKIPSCEDFPTNSVTFLGMTAVTSEWELANPPNLCNVKVSSANPSTLVFSFQNE